MGIFTVLKADVEEVQASLIELLTTKGNVYPSGKDYV